MIYGTTNSSVTFSITLSDGESTLYPVVKVWDEDGDSEGTFTMSHVSDGMYISNIWTPTINGLYHAMTVVYTDSGHTTESIEYGHGSTLIKVDSTETDITSILADTNELQTDWTNGGRLDSIIDELTSQGDTNEGKLDTIDTVVDTILVDTDTMEADLKTHIDTAETNLTTEIDANETKIDIIDTVVDTILVDTAEIGVAGAGLSDIPWNSSWDSEVQSECDDALNSYDPPTKAELDTAETNIIAEIDANEAKIDTIDGIVDNILIDTAAINWTNVTDILSDTNELQTDWVDGGRLDLIIDVLTSSVSLIYNIESGGWHRTGTQQIFYKSDNATEVARFNLKKNDGSPAGIADDATERERT